VIGNIFKKVKKYYNEFKMELFYNDIRNGDTRNILYIFFLEKIILEKNILKVT